MGSVGSHHVREERKYHGGNRPKPAMMVCRELNLEPSQLIVRNNPTAGHRLPYEGTLARHMWNYIGEPKEVGVVIERSLRHFHSGYGNRPSPSNLVQSVRRMMVSGTLRLVQPEQPAPAVEIEIPAAPTEPPAIEQPIVEELAALTETAPVAPQLAPVAVQETVITAIRSGVPKDLDTIVDLLRNEGFRVFLMGAGMNGTVEPQLDVPPPEVPETPEPPQVPLPPAEPPQPEPVAAPEPFPEPLPEPVPVAAAPEKVKPWRRPPDPVPEPKVATAPVPPSLILPKRDLTVRGARGNNVPVTHCPSPRPRMTALEAAKARNVGIAKH